MRYWQSDNRISTAVLPHLRATQKGNLARPHSRSPQAVRKPEGLAMHCHLHRGDWSFHLTNEKKKKKITSLNPSRGREGAALLNAAPAVSTSDGHGQGLGSWKNVLRSTQQCCPSIYFSVCPFIFHLEWYLGGWSSIGHWLLSRAKTNVVFFSSCWSAALL